ncbi:HNH endonuclease [Natrarchaeobius chitinivorans]|nr:HNH endonuclease signature motif containing protein [Natrarchaeobius chitinivorans]
MSIEGVSRQQLNTHPELGWDPSNDDMALQRVNWLRSLGVVQKDGDQYALTAEGRQFADNAVEEWAGSTMTEESDTSDSMMAGTYETTVEARAIDPEFRATALYQFDQTCAVSDVDHPALLDVAHILPWSDYPEYRADLQNVLPLSKIHHAAFDRRLFTIDAEFHLQVNPQFETDSQLLRETICDRAGERISLPENTVSPKHLEAHNAVLEWV